MGRWNAGTSKLTPMTHGAGNENRGKGILYLPLIIISDGSGS